MLDYYCNIIDNVVYRNYIGQPTYYYCMIISTVLFLKCYYIRTKCYYIRTS